MVEMKFTPGPWTCERQDQESGDIYYAVHGAGYAFVTNVYESAANARLISAAPDLVAALEDIVANIDSLTRLIENADAKQTWRAPIANARAAISKALGK